LDDGRPEIVQLHAAVVGARPDVEEALAELGMPHQRGQVVEHHSHTNVVDRRVGDGPDGVVGGGPAAEQPHIAGPRQVHGRV
jgi:hypothetical protein